MNIRLSVMLFFPLWQSLESLQSEVVMDLLRKSNVEIRKVRYGEFPSPTMINHELLDFYATSIQKDLSPDSSSPNDDTSLICVAMLSTLSKNSSASLSLDVEFSCITYGRHRSPVSAVIQCGPIP